MNMTEHQAGTEPAEVSDSTLRYRDAEGRYVEIALDRNAAPLEREQIAAFVQRAAARLAARQKASAPRPNKVRGCDDGELFRSWAHPG